ncbi:MAG: glycosyltransferase family 2 protein [bacterium]
MEPSVSVIIPTYNRPKFLKTAVNSVLDQTFQDFELIIVDDGSQQALDCPEDSRVHMIRHEENRGVAAARNTGILASKASWVATLDDDDRWRPHKLERQIQFVHDHPEAVAVQPEAVWYRDGELVNQKDHHSKPDGNLLPRAMERCLVSASGVMLHSSVFSRVGYRPVRITICGSALLFSIRST